MRLEVNARGHVVNEYDDDAQAGEWYPDDTVLAIETPDGSSLGRGPLRVSRHQADDWPDRAARAWNAQTKRWESTGGQPQESDLEKVVRLLRNNPIDQLSPSPAPAEVVAKVNELARHAEGRRKLWIKLLTVIGRRFYG